MRLKEEYREMTIINKSKFIACVFPCRNEEEARSYIEKIKKEYSDATHVCTAYMVGDRVDFAKNKYLFLSRHFLKCKLNNI